MSVTLSDTGVLAGGAWVRPTVKVANLLRNADANNVKVYVEVLDSAGQRLDLLRENLARVPMADTVGLVFADSLQVPDYTGKFWVRAYVEAAMYETDRANLHQRTVPCLALLHVSDTLRHETFYKKA